MYHSFLIHSSAILNLKVCFMLEVDGRKHSNYWNCMVVVLTFIQQIFIEH